MATNTPTLRVAIASGCERQRDNLKCILEKNGLQVVVNHIPDDQFLKLINQQYPDVLLLDLDDENEEELNFLDLLLERSDLPVLFNDSVSTRMNAATISSDWGRMLARKLTALVVVQPSAPVRQPQTSSPPITDRAYRANVTEAIPLLSEATVSAVKPVVAREVILRPPLLPLIAQRVWVLGASIGGPQAVKRFLSAIPVNLPVAFILAQHIGKEFIGLLAEQLNTVAPFEVLLAQPGHILRHQQVVLAPVEEQLTINVKGEIELYPAAASSLYRPSIDAVMVEIAKRYRNNAGAIIFSGMGDDGVKGSRAVTEQGGLVWAQDAASSMIDGMPGQARKAGGVSLSATPEILAQQLTEHLTIAPRAGVMNAL